MSGDILGQIGGAVSSLVGNWQYFVDGCLGGIFLELAVLGGLTRVHRVHIANRGGVALYTICCVVGGGLYASRFLGATSHYTAMVEGFTFPITLGSIGGTLPGRETSPGSRSARTSRRRAAVRNALRERLEGS
jgi:hypothetical protein